MGTFKTGPGLSPGAKIDKKLDTGIEMGEIGIGAASALGSSLISGVSGAREAERNTKLSGQFQEDVDAENQANTLASQKIEADQVKFQRQLDALTKDHGGYVIKHNNFLNAFQDELNKSEVARGSAEKLASDAASNDSFRQILRQTGSL